MAGAAVVLSLSSCELKEEMWGKSSEQPSGILQLGVSVKQPASMTRATTSDIDAQNTYPVTIEGDNLTEPLVYASAAVIPADLRLPVGEYTITAHTPGEMEKKMTSPYYGGTETIVIEDGLTVKASVVCKMKNSRIQMKYGDDFLNAFDSWTITINDGSETVLSYSNVPEEQGTTPIYWAFAENTVTTIKSNIRAVTSSGNTISESKSFKKSDAAESYDGVSDNFGGGDALVFQMGATESSSGTVTGVTVNTFISFEENDETVEIPTVDEPTGPIEPENPDTPTEPTGDLTVTYTMNEVDLFETGVTYSIASLSNDYINSVIKISAPAGLQNMLVTIIGGNEGFAEIVEGMGFTNRDLVGDTELGDLLSSLGVKVPMPEAGATTYDFPIGQFFTMMNLNGATTNDNYGDDYHTFSIKIVDKSGKESGTKEVSLKVTINE